MAELAVGDRVRIASRAQTEEDIKAGNYYAYFGGLTGSVQKVFNATEVAVDIEHESLTREMRKRHEDVRTQMKTKWMDDLSEEGRSKLTEREKDFTLRYVVLVSPDDIEKIGGKSLAAEKAEAKAEAKANASAEEAPKRKTSEEIAADEEAELQRRLGV